VEMLREVTPEQTAKPPKQTAATTATVKICVEEVEEPVASHPDKGELTGGWVVVCSFSGEKMLLNYKIIRSFRVINKEKYQYLKAEL